MLFTTPMPTDSNRDSYELDEITLAQISGLPDKRSSKFKEDLISSFDGRQPTARLLPSFVRKKMISFLILIMFPRDKKIIILVASRCNKDKTRHRFIVLCVGT